jgi:DNA polymerase III subunit epsilon
MNNNIDGVGHLRYLFFDTETTGLPKGRSDPVMNPENWPRVVQIAWILYDENEKITEEQCHIIYPDGFLIPSVVAKIHGITTAIAQKKGKPLEYVLPLFTDAVFQSELIIGHNIEFDRNVMAAEYARSGEQIHIHSCPYFCTMKGTVNFCKIPYPSGRKGNKWPKLMELHQVLFDVPFEGAHDALADVRACARCFFELKRLNHLEPLIPSPKKDLNMEKPQKKKRLASVKKDLRRTKE